MEIEAVVPAWLTWVAAGGAAVVAVTAVAHILQAVFDLDRG